MPTSRTLLWVLAATTFLFPAFAFAQSPGENVFKAFAPMAVISAGLCALSSWAWYQNSERLRATLLEGDRWTVSARVSWVFLSHMQLAFVLASLSLIPPIVVYAPNRWAVGLCVLSAAAGFWAHYHGLARTGRWYRIGVWGWTVALALTVFVSLWHVTVVVGWFSTLAVRVIQAIVRPPLISDPTPTPTPSPQHAPTTPDEFGVQP